MKKVLSIFTWSPPEQAPLYSLGMFQVEYIQQYASNTSCSTPPLACNQILIQVSLLKQVIFYQWLKAAFLRTDSCDINKLILENFPMVFNTHRTGITVYRTSKKLTEKERKISLNIFLILLFLLCAINFSRDPLLNM